MWWWSLYLWNERLIISAEDFSRFGGSICFNSTIVFSWLFVISLVMEAMGLPSPFFLFYALVDNFIRFLDTDLSLLICLSVIEINWRKEIVTVTDVRYSWKTVKTSKMNGIVWVKKDKLTTYSEQRLQRINASREDHHPSKRPFQVEEMD